MKKIILPWALISTILFSCSQEHEHEADKNGLEALAYTLYTDKTELFVEFKPLVAGTENKFAAHFTE
ncbi:MAG: efflux RND transporter periplasmic adaptor subunit, partial [Bacteroidota bacterium]